jgi:hypothetical protein
MRGEEGEASAYRAWGGELAGGWLRRVFAGDPASAA